MTTTTTLVHRAHNGPLEWWRDGLVYEVASPELGAVELGGVEHLVDHVASLGFTALLLRPSLMDARTPSGNWSGARTGPGSGSWCGSPAPWAP